MVQWTGHRLPMQGVQGHSLVGALRSRMPRGQKTKPLKKNPTRNTAVTNSIKTKNGPCQFLKKEENYRDKGKNQ